MTVRIDPALGVGAAGPAPGRLGDAEPPVVRAGVATGAPFLLDGERVAVAGSERRGEHAVWVDGTLVLANLTTDGGSCVNLVAAPSTLRRELLGAHTTLVETTLAAPALPLAAVQWAVPPGGRAVDSLDLAFTVLPAERDIRYHVEGEGVRAVAGAAGPSVEIRVHPAPSEWVVVEGPAGGLGVRASVPGSSPTTLVVAAGTPEAAARALAAAPHLGAHEIRAAAEADPANLDTLCTATGVPDLDHGIVWATARVRGGARRRAAPEGADAFWWGLGALAVGDAESALRALELLRGSAARVVPWALGPSAPTEALAAILAARSTLLSGNPTPARQALAALDPGTLDLRRRDSDDDAWSLWSLALDWLGDALREAASEDDIGRLRQAAALPAGKGGIRLPMAGGSPPTGPGGVLRRLVEGGTVSPLPPFPSYASLGCWAAWVAGDPDGAYTAWRGLLGRGLAGGLHGRGCWDPPTTPPGGGATAAVLLCGLSHGLLGLTPDAPSGRIRVAPAFPAHLTSFVARGIRVGEARFTLRFQRDGSAWRLALEPTRGRVPPMVILEPLVPFRLLRETRVDGAPAALDAQREGAGTRVRVQIPLDGPRTLDVDGAP